MPMQLVRVGKRNPKKKSICIIILIYLKKKKKMIPIVRNSIGTVDTAPGQSSECSCSRFGCLCV